MWKDSYAIGVPNIDLQHKELFRMTEGLLKAIEKKAKPAVFEESLNFLKDYVIFHFLDEEEYQRSIHYAGFEAHKKEHEDFTQTVQEYETKLKGNGFELSTLKDLAGTLTAWLIYHVADSDQKFAKGESFQGETEKGRASLDVFSDSAVNVIEKMAGFKPEAVCRHKVKNYAMKGDVFIKIGLIGDLPGQAIFCFSKELALNLIEIMTFTSPEDIDEMVTSALAELTNIACGNAATYLAREGIRCDITTPSISTEETAMPTDGVLIETSAGGLEVVVLNL